MKKMPAPVANTASLMERFLSICSFAKTNVDPTEINRNVAEEEERQVAERQPCGMPRIPNVTSISYRTITALLVGWQKQEASSHVQTAGVSKHKLSDKLYCFTFAGCIAVDPY